jgi:fluoride ion exporter CrcB/FEX
MAITTANESPTLPTVMKEKTRTMLHRFFYPHQHKEYLSTHSSGGADGVPHPSHSGHRRHRRSSENDGIDQEVDDDDHHHDSHDNDRRNDGTNQKHGGMVNNPKQSQDSKTNDFSHVDNDNNNRKKRNKTQETKHTPNDERFVQPDMNDPDVKFVTNFWTTFDDVLILSIFTQLGIVFRLAIAIWFTWFDGVFSNDSALFVNLPLNCLSCFFMGLLCSGERLMETISTRFSPPRTQQTIVQEQQLPGYEKYHDDDGDDDDDDENGLYIDRRSNDGIVRHRTAEIEFQHCELHHRRRQNTGPFNNILRGRRRRTKKDKRTNHERFISWQPPVCLDEELRDVQLLALERRIRMSKCLVLFPVRKQDVDVMEHYFQHGYKRDNEGRSGVYDDAENRSDIHNDDMNNTNSLRHNGLPERRLDNSLTDVDLQDGKATARRTGEMPSHAPNENSAVGVVPNGTDEATAQSSSNSATPENNPDYIAEITDLATNIQDNVQENLYRLRRVNLADGWDSGTTASAMSDDLMLGLRDGFCGALSSFSSWNSAMVALLRKGQVTQALVGYMIGLQLPIVAYRFGQNVAVYIFIWRTRRETRTDERRGGYGIRIANDEDDIEQIDNQGDSDEDDDEEKKRKAAENEMPSLRAVITAIFIMAIVTQCTSIFFYDTPENQQIALSLLFSPLGVFARWRLTKLNRWKPTFPIGTFTCNILACALSGSLGGKNQVVLVSIVNGFGGTLSSLASFVVEILAGIDPILFRYDGVIYAAASIGCAMVVGFIFSASVEWADAVVTRSAAITDMILDDGGTMGNVTGNLTRYW